MTAEQKRLRIAKLQGIEQVDEESWWGGCFADDAPSLLYVPDYLNDRNAMARVLRSLDDEEWLEFMLRLCDVLGQQPNFGKWTLARAMLEATASQQATAYLLVKNEYDP